jgi:hypothetical protein
LVAKLESPSHVSRSTQSIGLVESCIIHVEPALVSLTGDRLDWTCGQAWLVAPALRAKAAR